MSSAERIYGEGYYLLISACGKIPEDLQLEEMAMISFNSAKFRAVPFEFLGETSVRIVAPGYLEKFDLIVGTLTTEITHDCNCCGCELDGEEQESPRLDADGDPICDGCYQERYEFTCCWCEELEHIDHQHKLLVVDNAEEAGMPRGVYEIVRKPYYADGMIEGHLYEDALKRIADVPDGLKIEWYPCGHLCKRCQGKITTATNRTAEPS